MRTKVWARNSLMVRSTFADYKYAQEYAPYMALVIVSAQKHLAPGANPPCKLVRDLKEYATKYLNTDYSQDAILRGRALLARVENARYAIGSESRCQLEYWEQLVKLIHGRIARADSRVIPGWCTPYNTLRFEMTGLPMYNDPTLGLVYVEYITIIFAAIGGVFQLIRAQMDGEFSFWAQVLYTLSGLMSIAYYALIRHPFIITAVGSLTISVATLVGVLIHKSAPWESL